MASCHPQFCFVSYHDVMTSLILAAYTISYLAFLGARGTMGRESLGNDGAFVFILLLKEPSQRKLVFLSRIGVQAIPRGFQRHVGRRRDIRSRSFPKRFSSSPARCLSPPFTSNSLICDCIVWMRRGQVGKGARLHG
jgi:hypothetical protein